MNALLRFKIFHLVLVFLLLSSAVEAARYYVVVGTFAHESNAQKFTNLLRSFYKEASYEFNPDRHLYYVHVLKTDEKEEAKNWSLYLKYEKGFKDVWVLTETETAQGGRPAPETSASRVPRFEDNSVQAANSASVVPTVTLKIHDPKSTTSAGATSDKVLWNDAGQLSYASGISGIRALTGNAKEAARVFTFVVENSDGTIMPSEVMLVDFEKVKRLASIKPGEHVAIRGTKREQVVTFVCDVLGYTMETKMLNIDHLSRVKNIRLKEDGVWEVRFKLKKMAVDDVSFLDRTTFYKDASVLEPDSETEVKALLAMMKSNPGYKIVIHSHCNPGIRREISLPLESGNYFDIEQTTVKKGTDKMLTKARAEMLRDFLVNHGVDRKRVGVMGWGSLDPLVSSTAKDADLNERIEVELVAE